MQLVGWRIRAGGWADPHQKTVKFTRGSKRWLIGTQLWDGTDTDLYIFEGETDMLRFAQDNPGLGLSICYGGTPPKDFQPWLDCIHSMVGDKNIYLGFDEDEQGEEFTRNFEDAHGYTNLYRLRFPDGAKDYCEAGTFSVEKLPTRPPGLFTSEEIKNSPNHSREFITTGIVQLDKLIGGYHPGKFIMLAGLAKSGKSQFAVELVNRYTQVHQSGVLFIPLELTPEETLERIEPHAHDYVMFVRHFGGISIKLLDKYIRYAAHVGHRLVVIDHITAAATDYEKGLETSHLDGMLYKLKALVNELGIYLVCVSHVNASCEGVVLPNHMRGSAALLQVPSSILGLRRTDGTTTELRSVTADRDTGKRGLINMEFDGQVFIPFSYREI